VENKDIMLSAYFFIQDGELTSYACSFDKEKSKIDIFKYHIKAESIEVKETVVSFDYNNEYFKYSCGILVFIS